MAREIKAEREEGEVRRGRRQETKDKRQRQKRQTRTANSGCLFDRLGRASDGGSGYLVDNII